MQSEEDFVLGTRSVPLLCWASADKRDKQYGIKPGQFVTILKNSSAPANSPRSGPATNMPVSQGN